MYRQCEMLLSLRTEMAHIKSELGKEHKLDLTYDIPHFAFPNLQPLHAMNHFDLSDF